MTGDALCLRRSGLRMLCCIVQAACFLFRSGQAEVSPQPSRFVSGWVFAMQHGTLM